MRRRYQSRAGCRLFALALLVPCPVAFAQDAPWQVPAQGTPLSDTDLNRLAGKTCSGYFDRGNNSESARGAVFIAFSGPPVGGELWRKWGKDAEYAPRTDVPTGYDDMGKLGPVRITTTATEITYKASNWFFDWFIHPIGDGAYLLRAVGTTESSRGATGRPQCH